MQIPHPPREESPGISRYPIHPLKVEYLQDQPQFRYVPLVAVGRPDAWGKRRDRRYQKNSVLRTGLSGERIREKMSVWIRPVQQSLQAGLTQAGSHGHAYERISLQPGNE
jgi:hypothetical protein